MNPERRGRWVVGFLLIAWLIIVAWQVDEHCRVVEAARNDLRGSSQEIARTLGAVTRAFRFHGAIFQRSVELVLNELVKTRTNAIVKSSGLVAVGLLNTEGDLVVSAGDTDLLSHEVLGEREHWSDKYVTFVLPVEGASVSSEGVTNNPTVVLPSFPNMTNGEPRGGREFRRREPGPDEFNSTNAREFSPTNFPPPTNGEVELPPPPPPDDRDRPPEGGERPRGHRPPWMRFGMSEADFKALIAKRELHGLVLAMSTDNYRDTCAKDFWLRFIIVFFAGISAAGTGLALRNVSKTADLQIRLVRASELNSHLKEMNLAAAGLAHETRNPLNIIRGLAQMLSKQTDAPPDIREKTRVIVEETDKVTAQLTEFINYSRPREVRPAAVALHSAIAEILRTLNHDLAEKKIRVTTDGEPLTVEADEQLLRQVLFNLLINAIQAVNEGGRIQILAQRLGAHEASLEIRDDGSGVAPENRSEIFKPYFTTHQKGTGLGLAVVQQIVHAHGWEIECLANEPKGAVFRISHLKLAEKL
jgi:signal transduction histidine kinase